MFWAGVSTLSYLPSTFFPTGFSQDSLPIGLQAISVEYNDYVTMDFVRLLTSAAGGFQAHPVTTSYENQSPVTSIGDKPPDLIG